ncbi:MAG: hypothetical protein A2Y20_03490 [Firmicutes bacterium GWF2_51_9]|nr:MAG: hypothetical protein A2Y20_03490 [Firmicutes bacterium GWF2_51_9]OGS57856.1 MAG: hypothetical protein A2Y19_10290 [Firmicutes bacterium GWE2_51_13]HBZ41363.1 hypothetical protein [Erysipelotrichaceae bacterium]
MRSRVNTQVLRNYVYLLAFIVLVLFVGLAMTDFVNHILSQNLVKDRFPPSFLVTNEMDESAIAEIAEVNGGVYFIDSNLTLEHLGGIDPFGSKAMSRQEFTRFLTDSRKVGLPYSLQIEYSETLQGWVVVVFPTSLRIDLAIVANQAYESNDKDAVMNAIYSMLILIGLFLSLGVVVLSRIGSRQFLKPIRKLSEAVTQIKHGNYSHRVVMKASKEFEAVGELFNEMAEEVEKKEEALVVAQEKRQQLILDISHDLRNPLSVILGFADILTNQETTPQQQHQFSSLIKNHGLRAKTLIDSLFDLSTLESPEFKMKKTRVNGYEYLRMTIADLLPVIEQAGCDYRIEIPDERYHLEIDPSWMDRVFTNLITNAIQHNDQPITISITAGQSSEGFEVRIEDDGVGIDPGLIPVLFERFTKSNHEESASTGLGLSIVKKVVEMHGGRIHCENKKDGGCAFVLSFPSTLNPSYSDR